MLNLDPPEDREQFNKWSNIVSLIVDPLLEEWQVHQVRQAVDEKLNCFEALLSRLDSLRLVEEPRYWNHKTLRGLESLWLEEA